MTIDLNRVSAVLRQMAAIASMVVGAVAPGGLPASVRAPLVAVGGILLAVEHLVAGITTTTTTASKPAAPAAPVTSSASSHA